LDRKTDIILIVLPYSETLTIPASAIDQNGHVNNLVYLQWCIDVAEKHWLALAPASVIDTHFWVVLNHYIEYHQPSFEGEEIKVETWVTSAKGVKSEREYQITRQKDGETLVTAKTTWCYVELDSQRPARITDKIRRLFLK